MLNIQSKKLNKLIEFQEFRIIVPVNTIGCKPLLCSCSCFCIRGLWHLFCVLPYTSFLNLHHQILMASLLYSPWLKDLCIISIKWPQNNFSRTVMQRGHGECTECQSCNEGSSKHGLRDRMWSPINWKNQLADSEILLSEFWQLL